jgi:prepilin-type N-terminal cleavage/methylation domain-containing protein
MKTAAIFLAAASLFAFSLVETLVVIVVLAILMAVLFPAYCRAFLYVRNFLKQFQ